MLAGQVAAPAAAWPVADLHRRVRNALRLIGAAVTDFGTQGYADPVRPALGFGPEKILAEASMLAYVAARVPEPRTKAAALELAGHLAPLVRSRDALADLALRPQRVFKRAVPHVLLTRLGLPDEDFDARARPFAQRILGHAIDEAGTVLAERYWIARLWSLPELPVAGDLGWSLLARPLDLLPDSREEAYGVTHLLMYATDFGGHPSLGAHRGPARIRSRAEIAGEVEALLARYLDRADDDLCAELLLAWPQLRLPWTPGGGLCLRRAGDSRG